MSDCSIIENPSHELWQSILDMCPEGNFEQSFEYGAISEMTYPNTHAIRLAITNDEKPVALVQGIYSRYLGFGMTLHVNCGPVAQAKDPESLWLLEKLLIALETYAKRKRIIRAQILVPESWHMNEVIGKSGFSLSGYLNEYVVKLEKNPEDLWARIDRNKRKNIKKATKSEVEVFQSCSVDDIHTFYSMFEATKKRKGFWSYPLSWFESFLNMNEPEKLCKLFLARWNGKIVSGVFVVIHGKTVYAFAAASYADGWKVRANDIVHWKVMEWACRNGFSRYHMGWLLERPPAKGTPSWGVWRWKKEWNGSLERIQKFDKLLMPKYGFVLKGKKIAERAYKFFK